MRPHHRDPQTPGAHHRRVDRGARFAPLVAVVHVHGVGVPVPGKPHHRSGVIETEVHPRHARPPVGDLQRALGDLRLVEREDRTGPQHRDPLGPRSALVRRIGRDDPGALFCRVVQRVLDRHRRHVGADDLLVEEALHHLRYAEQRREGHERDALGRVGPGQPLGVNLKGWLLVEPHEVQGFALPLLALLVVGLERDHAVAVGGPLLAVGRDVLDGDHLDRVRHPVGVLLHIDDAILGDRTGAPGSGAPQQVTLHAIARHARGLGSRPGRRLLVKDLAWPPRRVGAGEVHRCFAACRERLPELVAGYQQPFANGRVGARGVKLQLLGVGYVLLELPFG